MSRQAKQLYKFVINETDTYTITNMEPSYDYLGDTYAPETIGRSKIESNGDMQRQGITISLPLDNTYAQEWFASAGDIAISLTVFSVIDGEVSVEWKGRMAAATPKPKTFDFMFESIYTSLRRQGLREAYQVNCRYALYGNGCNLNKADFDVTLGVTGVVAGVVTVPGAASYADGTFTAGIFEDNAGNLRFITNHVGNQITLIRPLTPLLDYVAAYGYTGLTCKLYRGCDRTKETCKDVFNNLNNYGGFPFLPRTNPFGGSSII